MAGIARFMAEKTQKLNETHFAEQGTIFYDHNRRTWQRGGKIKRNFAAEKRKERELNAKVEETERAYAEEQETRARLRKEETETETELIKMRSAAQRQQLFEWRMRQRGELINDPREAEKAQREIEKRMGGGYELLKKIGKQWRNQAVNICVERWRLATLVATFDGVLDDPGIQCAKTFVCTESVTCVEESDNIVFAGLRGSQIVSYDIMTGRPITSFFGHKNFVLCIQCFGGHQAGGMLYSGSSDHTVKAWDLDPYKHSYHCVHTYECHGMVKGLQVITSEVDSVTYLYAACWDMYLER